MLEKRISGSTQMSSKPVSFQQSISRCQVSLLVLYMLCQAQHPVSPVCNGHPTSETLEIPKEKPHLSTHLTTSTRWTTEKVYQDRAKTLGRRIMSLQEYSFFLLLYTRETVQQNEKNNGFQERKAELSPGFIPLISFIYLSRNFISQGFSSINRVLGPAASVPTGDMQIMRPPPRFTG